MTVWTPNQGRRPSTGEKLLKVRWANGNESRYEYKARQLVWEKRGWDFDIAEVARV